MKTTDSTPKSYSMDDCIAQIRKTVYQVSPLADEEETDNKASSFTINGKPILEVRPFEEEIGITTTPEARDAFRRELGLYRQDENYTYFPLHKPMPLNLIARIARFKRDSYEYITA